MALLQWDPALNTGLAQVDGQHQELYRRINRLLDAASQGKGKAEVGATIDFLQSYVVEHFQSEQQYMRSRNYPDLAAHKQLHDAFIAELAELKRQYEESGATTVLVIQVQRKVGDWLRSHIAGEDQRFAAFVRGQG